MTLSELEYGSGGALHILNNILDHFGLAKSPYFIKLLLTTRYTNTNGVAYALENLRDKYWEEVDGETAYMIYVKYKDIDRFKAEDSLLEPYSKKADDYVNGIKILQPGAEAVLMTKLDAQIAADEARICAKSEDATVTVAVPQAPVTPKPQPQAQPSQPSAPNN